MDINDLIKQKISKMSPEQQMQFINGLSDDEANELASSIDISNNKVSQEPLPATGFMAGLGEQIANDPIASTVNDLTVGLAAGGIAGEAVGAGLGALGLTEGILGSVLGTGAEGAIGSLVGEEATNISAGRDTTSTDRAAALGIGGALGLGFGAAGQGVKKALSNETVREGINKIVSTAGNTLKSVGQNVDDATNNIFNSIIKTREAKLNPLNKKLADVKVKASQSTLSDDNIIKIANVIDKADADLGGGVRGLGQIKNILNKPKVTQGDAITISEMVDDITFESGKSLSTKFKDLNVKDIVDSTLPQEFKSVNNEFTKVFREFGDPLDENFQGFTKAVKAKLAGKEVPTEKLTEILTSTTGSKQAISKKLGELADSNVIDVKDLETVFLGNASRSAKQIPDIISEGNPELIREITSGPFDAADELNRVAAAGDFVQQSGRVDPNNIIPDPTKVFEKFNDSKFTGALKNALGKKGSTTFTKLNNAAKDVNKTKILSDQIKGLSNEAAIAGQESSILDASLQGLGAAQDAATLNSRLGLFQGVANPAATSGINQLTQFTLGQLGPNRRR